MTGALPVNNARVGLVGCGVIASSSHVPAMAQLPGLVTPVAVADVRIEAARAAAARLGSVGCEVDAYDDYRRILDRADIDLVVVATPDFLHKEHVIAAAEAGKHVLCEKPMALTLDDADAMIRACEQAHVRLMIGHSRRFTGRYLAVRKAIDTGRLGCVRLMRENERRPRPAAGVSGSFWTAGHWSAEPQYSLGVALTTGVHEVDLFRWFAGSEAVRVCAEMRATRPGLPVPDFMTLVIEFENGAIASSEMSNSVPAGYPMFHQLDVIGTEGAIQVKDDQQQTLVHYQDHMAAFPDAAARLLHVQDAYTAELAAFVRAWQQDAPVPLDPHEARAALRIALAAIESAQTGKAVRLGTASGGANP